MLWEPGTQEELPPSFEEIYAAETHRLLVNQLRLALKVGVCIYAVFFLLDLVVAQEHLWTFLAIRLFVVTIAGLGVAGTYSRIGERQAWALSLGVLLLASMGVTVMTAYLGGFNSDYYVGNLLVLFFVGLFMPWSLRSAVSFCVLSCGPYFLINMTLYGPSSEAASAAFFLVGTSAFTVLAAIVGERRRRRDLALRLRLQQANLELKKLDEAKTRFFSNVSHELRTPLMLILGPLESLLQRRQMQDPRPLLDTMFSNVQRLLRQVNMLLDFSKLDATRLECAPKRGNLGELVSSLSESARAFAQQRGIRLSIEGLDDLRESTFDPDIVETIMANLLSNALKFTPRGGNVTVSATEGSDTISLYVSDTGCGIPQNALETIFDRFHQLDSSSTHKPEGTGLGLALVKELVRLHGGTIDLVSQVDQGTTFCVNLPRRTEAQTERRRGVRRREDRAAHAYLDSQLEERHQTQGRIGVLLADLRGPSLASSETAHPTAGELAPRLMIVEDNDDLRAYLLNELGRSYRVQAASNGQEALKKMAEFHPQLVISDIMMPRMDGYELCRRIKTNPITSATPMILLTAKAGTEAVVEGLDVGADDYVTKPFDMRELEARISAQLRSRSMQRRLEEQESRLMAIGKFASSVVHDIRSPLQAIIGHADVARMLLLRQEARPAAGEDVAAIKHAAWRASRMLDQVVEFARSGSIQLELSDVEFGPMLQLTVNELRAPLDAAGIKLHLDTEDLAGVTLSADRSHLRRIVQNLVMNAYEALQQQLSAHLRPQIWIMATADDKTVRLQVDDSGPGIPSELAEKLFKPFATARKSGGTGLGLSIVSNLVKAHGGRAYAVEQPSRGGASFVVELPRVVSPDLILPLVAESAPIYRRTRPP